MRLVLRIMKIVLINLLLCIVFLIPIELYFGTWFSGEGAIARFDSQPNFFQKIKSPSYPGGRIIIYRRDKYGFRGGPVNPATIDVLAIGGSTTNERFLDENDTWTAVLQRLLRAAGCPVTIANAGIDGYSTAGNIASFHGWFDRIPGLRPRVVLVYLGINDAVADPRKIDFLGSQRYLSHWRQIEHFVAAHSALHRLLALVRGALRAHAARLGYNETPAPAAAGRWRPASLPPGFAAVVARKVSAYRFPLAELNRLIRQFGAQPVYVTQVRGDGRLVDGEWQEIVGSDGARQGAALAAIDDATLAFCRKTGEICIDLARRAGLKPEDFSDYIHLSPAGAARVGRFLAAALTPELCRKPD